MKVCPYCGREISESETKVVRDAKVEFIKDERVVRVKVVDTNLIFQKLKFEAVVLINRDVDTGEIYVIEITPKSAEDFDIIFGKLFES